MKNGIEEAEVVMIRVTLREMQALIDAINSRLQKVRYAIQATDDGDN